jgi:hypothetical protein
MQWVLDAIKEVPKLHDVSVDSIYIATFQFQIYCVLNIYSSTH